jgi:hypothetical protein
MTYSISLAAAAWGGAATVLGLGSAVFVSLRLSGRLAPPAEGVAARATVALLLAVTQLVAVELVCGMLFALYPPVVLAVNLLMAGVVWRLVPARAASSPPRRPPVGWSSAVLGAVLGFASCAAVVMSARGVPTDPDDVTYHLPNAAYWARVHEIWHLPPALPGSYTNSYPSDGELLASWAIQPFHDAQLATWPTLIFAGLILAACAYLAERLGGTARMGLLGGAVVLLTPLSWQTQVHSAFSDWAATGGLLTALAFLLRAREEWQVKWPVLAGTALGLGLGSKDTIVLPGALIVVFALITLPRPRWRSVALMVPGVAALSGVWYVRNWVDTGNPAYPEPVRIGGHVLFAGGVSPLNAFTTTLVGDVLSRQRSLLSEWLHLARVLVGLPAATCLGAVVAVAAFRTRPLLALTAGLSLAFFLAYAATPTTGADLVFLMSSAVRYCCPALFTAAVCSCVSSRWMRAMAWAGVGWDLYEIGGDHVFNPDVRAGPSLLLICTAAGLAVGAILLWADRPHRRKFPPGGPGIRPAASAVAALAAVIGAAILAGRPAAPDPIDRILTAGARSAPATAGRPVLVISATDLLAVLGPDLARPVEGVGTGTAGETPIEQPGELDRSVARLRPSAVVIGPAGGLGVVAGWTPAGYRLAGTVGADRIFLPDRT